MTQEIIRDVLPAVIAIASGLFGALFVGFINHLLTKDRERISGIATRNRDFLSFMQIWRHDVARIHRHSSSAGFEHDIAAFVDGISGFRASAEMIRKDFTVGRRKRFIELVDVVAKCHPHNTEDILKAMDEVCNYADAA